MNVLPIDEVIPRLADSLRSSASVILSAPPGAGKTTRVPLALLEQDWLAGGKILMLEPRRLAAQRAASYMAREIGESVGRTVGYRIRGETRIGSRTRIEVLTEGVLTRLLHADAGLAGVKLVIFDEFHERSIHADLALAFSLEIQKQLGRDLRLLVMSATLDGLSVGRVLAGAPVIESAGRAYPVETRYLTYPFTGAVEGAVAHAVHRACAESQGDILAFLPGRREISRAEALLRDREPSEPLVICPLFGDAPPEQQKSALGAAPEGKRKVILATSIAETSLTIDGVRAVIDCGLSRTPRFDARRGMSGLVTVPVSVASADQRRGRAGRQSAGICYRLWTEKQQAELPAHATPEILVADLAPLALDLARWGAPTGEGLGFIDPPPERHIAQARDLLNSLGALAPDGTLTPHGRAIADLPVHPRLAHMILKAGERNLGSLACELAALLEESDILRGGSPGDIDLASRVEALRTGRNADRSVRARALAEAERLRRSIGAPAREQEIAQLGILSALAYPERIARRRGSAGRRYVMRSGTGALLPEWSQLAREEFLSIVDVDGVGTEVKVFLAAPVEMKDLEETFSDAVNEAQEVFWDAAQEAVVARFVRRLGTLVLAEGARAPRGEAARAAMCEGVRQMGLASLPWSKKAESLRMRSRWLNRVGLAGPSWPDLGDDHLLSTLPSWLGGHLDGITRRIHLQTLDMVAILRSILGPSRLKELDRLAPETIALKSGSRAVIDYSAGETPVISVRLQEMFGQKEGPSVAGVRLLVRLLSPAGRPLALTSDLQSFWQNAYREVRKEMRGRYPKHIWPENPLDASPTKRTKKK